MTTSPRLPSIPLRADGRISLEDWANLRRIKPDTARRLCVAGNVVKARREGGKWWIDYAATETLASIRGGNAVERELATRGSR